MPENFILAPELTAEFALRGRIAVVTGAGSGIGRETAHTLVQAGAHVYLADIDLPGLIETQALIGDPAAATVHPTDVARREAVDALAQAALAASGRIDIWVNAAGVITTAPIIDASEAQIDRIVQVNFKGVYSGCAAAGRAMMRTASGSIINLSSSGGESPAPGLSIYSMTKAAVNALTRTAAAEFGPHGIRVNAVSPGWVDTPMGNHRIIDSNGHIDPEKRAEMVRSRAGISPLGLTGRPRDIALAILYLAADASRFVTGQIIRPNGGIAMP
jgi:3-oxoacyl-[acyl-carrier protein] reductase